MASTPQPAPPRPVAPQSVAEPVAEPATPLFPSWPFSCLAFYNRLAEDHGRYVRSLTRCTDVAEACRAEGDYGVSLFQDAMRAYYDLALAPLNAMAAAASAAMAAGRTGAETREQA